MKTPTQRHAHFAVAQAVRRGELVRPDACVACGASDGAVDAHHPNHRLPLLVQWLCRRCHVRCHIDCGGRAA